MAFLERTKAFPSLARELPGIAFPQMFAVHALLDEENRPLGEHRARTELLDVAPTEFKQCPYAGVRFKHVLPMNVSALRQTAQHWDDIAAGLAYLHGRFRVQSSPLTLPQLWRLLAAVAVLPSYLLFGPTCRTEPGRLPAFVAALYKAGLGIKYMLEQLLLKELLAGRDIEVNADVEKLIVYSESSGMLVGLHQVCAAPPSMIADTIRLLVDGNNSVASKCELAHLIDDMPRFQAFAHASHRLYATLLVFTTLAARLQMAVEALGAGVSRAHEHREQGALIEGAASEQNLSLTLAMRRICWPLARLEQTRCFELLTAFSDIPRTILTNEDENIASAVLAMLASADAVNTRKTLGAQFEQRLTARVHHEALTEVAHLLASYVCLERIVRERIDSIEHALNHVLGRGDVARDADPVLSGYCTVSVWEAASRALGIGEADDLELGLNSQ